MNDPKTAKAAAGEVVVRGCLAAKKGSEALRAANEVGPRPEMGSM